MKDIGGRIRRVRKMRGMTQVALAEAAGMSRSYLVDLERDKYNPTLEMLRSISSALHISVTELLGED